MIDNLYIAMTRDQQVFSDISNTICVLRSWFSFKCFINFSDEL